MFETLFKFPSTQRRYREAPLAHSRQQFLEDCERQGYSRTMLKKIAWVLLSLARAIDSQPGRNVSTTLIQPGSEFRPGG